MNPFDLRFVNTLRNGMAFPFKQILDTGVSGHDVLVRVAELSDYRAKRERYAKESGGFLLRYFKLMYCGFGVRFQLQNPISCNWNFLFSEKFIFVQNISN